LSVTDSYFAGHIALRDVGGSSRAFFAGVYYWPEVTGRLLDERLGSVHF